MAAKHYSAPTGKQVLIAKNAGLDPDKIVVREENDEEIIYQQNSAGETRFRVKKSTGKVQWY